MATKRSASAAASASQDPAKKAKRQVSVATFKKWQTNYKQEYQSLTWLRCDVDERDRSDCCGVRSVGDLRRESVVSRTSRASGLPDQEITSPAMS